VKIRALVAVAVALAIVAGVASAGRETEPRLRRLHRPPAPVAAPAPVTVQPDPVQPPSGGSGGDGSGSQPPPAVPPAAPPAPLPRTVAVDETEYSISLSRPLVGAGQVTFNVYNRGMDEHDLAVVDSSGVVRVVSVPSRESRSLVAELGVGRLRVYCSLFAGTPASHESLGMSAFVDVG
jgi:hypothetical protein